MKKSKTSKAEKLTPTVQLLLPDGTFRSISILELGCCVHAATMCASGVVKTLEDMPKAAAGITRKSMKNLGKVFIQTLDPVDGTQPL